MSNELKLEALKLLQFELTALSFARLKEILKLLKIDDKRPMNEIIKELEK